MCCSAEQHGKGMGTSPCSRAGISQSPQAAHGYQLKFPLTNWFIKLWNLGELVTLFILFVVCLTSIDSRINKNLFFFFFPSFSTQACSKEVIEMLDYLKISPHEILAKALNSLEKFTVVSLFTLTRYKNLTYPEMCICSQLRIQLNILLNKTRFFTRMKKLV